MVKGSIFKTHFVDPEAASDPESLFRNLHGRAASVRHLWSQQADVLRVYHQEHRKGSDVAIELPTGAGKTLIGLLIAEWRRQSLKQRVAYLCPTRQLAKQVGSQAKAYGIRAHVLIAPQAEYAPEAFADFQSGRQLAVSTYSGIFNTNPRIDSAQTLILDDAHAGENFIADMWSVEISRANDLFLYRALVELFKEVIDRATYAELLNESEWEPSRAGIIELIPGSIVRTHLTSIEEILNKYIQKKTSAWYSWTQIKSNLDACNVFVSGDGILIRPLIPPTHLHDPFIKANQRIYMSATLGLGGELERVTGIKRIQRLPVPSGWENRGSGRRFFIMPQLAVSDEEMIAVVGDTVEQRGRSLILRPGRFDAESSTVLQELQAREVPILHASDIEDSIQPFLELSNGALVLSRYDGLDLPDEACRQVIIAGLPCGTNMQEKFFWSRIAAYTLLRDRILTRFAQGVGRCTRSDNDYAAVFVVGRRMIEFMLKVDNRRLLHPELQAEIEFGIENSRLKQQQDFGDQLGAFFEQGEEWIEAEGAIESLRNQKVRGKESGLEQLYGVVSDEIEYIQAKWKGDLEGALQCARKVSDALKGDEMKSYRAWWYYLSADAAMALGAETGKKQYLDSARDLLSRAGNCCPNVSWFARLRRSIVATDVAEVTSELNIEAIEGVRRRLIDWGSVGSRFEDNIGVIGNDLRETAHKKFHRGLDGLGRMLGFASRLPDGNAVPDCVWSLSDRIYIVHEAKSEHTASDAIGVNDITQANRHGQWVKANLPCNQETKIVCFIVSPRVTISEEAVAHTGALCHVTPGELQDLHEQISGCLRRVRSKNLELRDEMVIDELVDEYSRGKLMVENVIDRLVARRVAEMNVENA